MGRTLGLLSILSLAGCGVGEMEILGMILGGESGLSSIPVAVTVLNAGTQAVKVDVPVDQYATGTVGSTLQFIVGAGESHVVTVNPAYTVRVVVTRTSDSIRIFDETWTLDEVKALGQALTVTVSP